VLDQRAAALHDLLDVRIRNVDECQLHRHLLLLELSRASWRCASWRC
jgi:hypothetical protein